MKIIIPYRDNIGKALTDILDTAEIMIKIRKVIITPPDCYKYYIGILPYHTFITQVRFSKKKF